jgi:hypothetical protein
VFGDRFDGAVGRFVGEIMRGPPHGTDSEMRAWMLLPHLAPDSNDEREERRRAALLALAAWRVLVRVLREHGDPQHARMLDDAVERDVLDPSLYGKAPPGCGVGSVGGVLWHLRLHRRYYGAQLAHLIEPAYWITSHFQVRYQGWRSGDKDKPLSAAAEAGKVYAHWTAYVGDRAYEEAQAAINAAAAPA